MYNNLVTAVSGWYNDYRYSFLSFAHLFLCCLGPHVLACGHASSQPHGEKGTWRAAPEIRPHSNTHLFTPSVSQNLITWSYLIAKARIFSLSDLLCPAKRSGVLLPTIEERENIFGRTSASFCNILHLKMCFSARRLPVHPHPSFQCSLPAAIRVFPF